MSGTLTKQKSAFSETVIDEEVVVMNLDSGDFFSLTGTARAAWELIDGTRDLAGLTAELAAAFHCDQAQVAADLAPFIDQLIAAGLVRRA